MVYKPVAAYRSFPFVVSAGDDPISIGSFTCMFGLETNRDRMVPFIIFEWNHSCLCLVAREEIWSSPFLVCVSGHQNMRWATWHVEPILSFSIFFFLLPFQRCSIAVPPSSRWPARTTVPTCMRPLPRSCVPVPWLAVVPVPPQLNPHVPVHHPPTLTSS